MYYPDFLERPEEDMILIGTQDMLLWRCRGHTVGRGGSNDR
jgi:hypothetical protein